MSGNRNWTQWRLEVSACAEYIELSFKDVVLRSDADAMRWAAELDLALRSFGRCADMLLDLHGVYVDEGCADACCNALCEVFDRHAESIAYYGASKETAAALEPCLRSRSDQGERLRSRSPALAQLMQQRRRRLGLGPMSHPASHFLASGNGWDESGAAFI